MLRRTQLSKQKTSHLGRVYQQERSTSTRLPDLAVSRGPPTALPQVAGQHRGSPALPSPLPTELSELGPALP